MPAFRDSTPQNQIPQTPGPSPRLSAGPLGVPIALVGYVVAIVVAVAAPMLIAPMLGAGAGGAAPGSAEDRSYLALPVQYLLLFVLGALLARVWLGGRYRPEALGLTFPRSAHAWVIGALGGLAFVVIGQLAGRLSAGQAEAGATVAAQLGFGQSLLRDVTVILSMAVFAPLGEEMIYRGLIFRGMHDALARSASGWVRRLAYAVPAVLSSLLFALSHGGEGQSAQYAFLLLAGLIYAWLYWWTGSLTVAVFGHSITNALNVVLIAGVGGAGLVSPLLWVLVAVTPLLAVALMWVLRKVLAEGRAS